MLKPPKPPAHIASATAPLQPTFLYRSTLKLSNPVMSTTFMVCLAAAPPPFEAAAPSAASQAPTASAYSSGAPASCSRCSAASSTACNKDSRCCSDEANGKQMAWRSWWLTGGLSKPAVQRQTACIWIWITHHQPQSQGHHTASHATPAPLHLAAPAGHRPPAPPVCAAASAR